MKLGKNEERMRMINLKIRFSLWELAFSFFSIFICKFFFIVLRCGCKRCKSAQMRKTWEFICERKKGARERFSNSLSICTLTLSFFVWRLSGQRGMWKPRIDVEEGRATSRS